MNIYLIGYRGSGKSTVGRILAERLGWDWVDSDEQIELSTHRKIRDIFQQDGEAAFREWEQSIIAGIAMNTSLVVSLGGGAILESINRQNIRKSGFSVWLTASPEALWERIGGDQNSPDNRPALTDLPGLEEVRQVLAHRTPVYNECADFRCDTLTRTPKQIAEEIADWWQSVDKMDAL